LMPRPPVEYIQETQEEDARIRDSVAEHDAGVSLSVHSPQELDLGPFTPFNLNHGGIYDPPGPPPPLPPKDFY
jgi:hypothetical protein